MGMAMNKYFIFTPLFLLVFALLGFSSESLAYKKRGTDGRSCAEACDGRDYQCVTCAEIQAASSSARRTPVKRNNSNAKKENGEKENTAKENGANKEGDKNAQGQNSKDKAPDNFASISATVDQCRSSLDDAQSKCDQAQNDEVQGSTMNLNSFANLIPSLSNQLGLNGVCDRGQQLVTAANAAVAAFSELCVSAKKSCMDSCQTARRTVSSDPTTETQFGSQVNGLIDSCKSLETNIQAARQGMENTVGALQGLGNCKTNFDTGLFDLCKTNPNAFGCTAALATDCSNPTVAASNPICICKANPNAESCTGINAKALGGENRFDSASMTPNGMNGAGGTDLPSGGFLDDPSWQGDPNLKADKSRSEEIGGSKGGRPLMEGGGGGSGGAGGRGAGGANGTGVAVNAGFRGGGGGGGGWGSGSSSGDAEARGAAVGTAVGVAGANGNPDLRQFLPGQKFDPKARGIAGMTGPDGITGPHSDIWRKIQNRYQIEKAKLMP